MRPHASYLTGAPGGGYLRQVRPLKASLRVVGQPGRVSMSVRSGFLSAGGACAVGLGMGMPAVAAPSDRATMAGSVPAWATSANFKGAVAATDSIGFRVYLGWSDPSAVEALAISVSDPASSAYGNYLIPQQFRQQFAPSQTSVGAIKSGLPSQGFSIVYTPMDNHYVEVEGTVAQAAATFNTGFGYYDHAGLPFRSASSELSVPSSAASLVSGVVGLDESAALVQTDVANDPAT